MRMNVNTNETFDSFYQTISIFGPRIIAAVVGGAIIGFENQVYQKPAGLRTNILLCIGCALVTIISILSGQMFADSATRITAQILTGIGFLGGGVILHQKERVQGVTTASTIFVNAAVGITVGTGFIFSGVAVALLAAIVLVLLKPVDSFVDNFPYFIHLRTKNHILVTHRKLHNEKIKQAAEKIVKNIGIEP